MSFKPKFSPLFPILLLPMLSLLHGDLPPNAVLNQLDSGVKRYVGMEAMEAYTEELPNGYLFYFHDLDGDEKNECLVLLPGSSFCGTGGCILLVLKEGLPDYFELIESISLCRDDGIWVTPKNEDGWTDLVRRTSGGGIFEAQYHVLSLAPRADPPDPNQPHYFRGEFKGNPSTLERVTFARRLWTQML